MTGTVLLLAVLLFADDKVMSPSESGKVISEAALYVELAKDPHFSNGVPPPGQSLRVEREVCGYRVHVDTPDADSFGGKIYVTDVNGKVVDITDDY